MSATASARLQTRGVSPLEALSDLEALQHLLARSHGARAEAAAMRLLDRFLTLPRVLTADLALLSGLVGSKAAADLQLVYEAACRLAAAELPRRSVISSWSALIAYLKVTTIHLDREAFHVLFLDKKNQLIADEVMALGTVDHAPVYPREVMRRALELSASAVILAHNHPSGDPTPSTADVDMTRQVIEAGRALRIAIHDHVVVGRDGVASFKALGLI
jgi:DNA repair protein RadC